MISISKTETLNTPPQAYPTHNLPSLGCWQAHPLHGPGTPLVLSQPTSNPPARPAGPASNTPIICSLLNTPTTARPTHNVQREAHKHISQYFKGIKQAIKLKKSSFLRNTSSKGCGGPEFIKSEAPWISVIECHRLRVAGAAPALTSSPSHPGPACTRVHTRGHRWTYTGFTHTWSQQLPWPLAGSRRARRLHALPVLWLLWKSLFLSSYFTCSVCYTFSFPPFFNLL